MSTGMEIDFDRLDSIDDSERMLQSLTAGVDLLERSLRSSDDDAADGSAAALITSLRRFADEIGERPLNAGQRAQLINEQARLDAAAGQLPAAPARAEEAPASPTQRRFELGRLRKPAARCLMALGVCLLLFVGFEYLVTGTLEARSQTSLLQQFRQRIAMGPFDAPSDPIESGAAGVLNIPAIGLHQVAVVQGASPSQLEQGPGHLPGTPLPGEFGNAVILGHRSVYGSPFAHLDQLRKGDPIIVLTGQGRFVYKVGRVVTVRPGQGDVIDPTLTSQLTLVTSVAATSPDRLAVIANLVGNPVGVPTRPPVTAASDQTGLVGSDMALLEALLCAQLLIVAVLVASRVYRTWPRAAAYAATTPPILFAAWLLFQSLSQAVPGTL